jgi:putative hydrolase of the HAD superfamily
MQTPKVVVFDLGKVLLDFDYTIAARKLAAESGASTEQIREFIDHSPLLIEYEKGRITRQEFFEEVRHMSGYQGTPQAFSAMFSDVFTPIEPMIELKRRLTVAAVPTYIFSNTNDLAITHIRAAYPFYNTFDGYVLSYEHGFMKPEAELYELVEGMTGQIGGSICYLDDRLENVEAGARRGWNAVLHRTPDESVETLKRLGL